MAPTKADSKRGQVAELAQLPNHESRRCLNTDDRQSIGLLVTPIPPTKAARKRQAAEPDQAPSRKSMRNNTNEEPGQQNPPQQALEEVHQQPKEDGTVAVAESTNEEEENDTSFPTLIFNHLYSDDASIVERALWDIENRIRNRVENAGEVYRLGGHTIIVKVMEKHSESIGIQMEGCVALRTISKHEENAKGPIGMAGGIDVILKYMKTYPTFSHNKQGCIALSELTNGCKENVDALVKSGGIPLVIKAAGEARLYTINADDVSDIIYNVCLQQEHRSHVIENDGIGFLGSIIIEDRYPKTQALKAMKMLLYGEEVNDGK
jgi:hypothetical protein